MLEAAVRSGAAERISRGGIAVFLREVIRLQPDLSPPEAVRRAVATPHATSVIVGVSSTGRLEQLVAACRDGAA